MGRWTKSLERRVGSILIGVGPILLRLSLGIVFMWFGALKVAGASAVGGLVAGTVPFLDSSWFVPALGILEVLIGIAFVTGRLLGLVLPVFALHIGGTFLVLIVLPDVSYEGNNPLMLTLVGEFVVKNLVLLFAGFVAATRVAVRPANGPGDDARLATRRRGRAIEWRGLTVMLVAVIATAITAPACSLDDSAGAASSGDEARIAVRDYTFEPRTLTADIGEAVTWRWEGSAQHDVVGEGFGSPTQATGSFRHVFDRGGTYPYACTLHPGMEGVVIVDETG